MQARKYIYIHINTHTPLHNVTHRTHKYTHTHTHTRTHVYMACMRVMEVRACVCACVRACSCKCEEWGVCMHSCACARACVCVCVRVSVCMHAREKSSTVVEMLDFSCFYSTFSNLGVNDNFFQQIQWVRAQQWQ